ncbi:MAG: type VI secretion system ImpA family N-terminal domain-containing protein [Lentisphaeraceae bacterium]|nr:type VI secretion system ImpA family N-terminal domain-containing protein [Lentisphaeraceae bacterium]
MSILSLDQLLSEVSSDNVCGTSPTENNEVQFLKVLVEDADPDWAKIKREALVLLKEHKDLQIAFYLTLALTKRDGILGFAEGIGLCQSFLEKWWDELYPELDEDDGDPYERVGILTNFGARFATNGDPYRVIEKLREAPLAISSEMRKEVSYREILLSRGELSVSDDQETVPTSALIDAIFGSSDQTKMLEISEALSSSLENLEKINEIVESKADESIPFGPLTTELTNMQNIIASYGTSQSGDVVEDVSVTTEVTMSTAAPQQKGISGKISSTDDVSKMLEMIIKYYEENEPSSPVPLMLLRTKTMIGKNFRELVTNISYSAKSQLDELFGEEPPA